MMELLLLLLPVAAASGWIAAKRSESRAKRLYPDYNPNYYKGLNYLLNEQPDKAIDVFVQMLEVDSETVETHLALGNLFRRRGEVDRAIRIHQNLIARPNLKREHRAQALLELGQDYMRAGLLDRAETLFRELTEFNLYGEQALGNLLVIYEREKEWKKSLQISSQLESITGRPMNNQQAHYYCELADDANAARDIGLASYYLKKAYACNKDSVRAAILLGEMEKAKGDYKAAIRTFKQISQKKPTHLSVMLASMRECFEKINAEHKFKEFLYDYFHVHKGLTEAIMLTQVIKEDEGDAAAVLFLKGYLKDNPSLDGLYHLVSLNPDENSITSSEILLLLRQLLEKMLEENPPYKCVSCGFNAKTMHWQCPSCNKWSSIKPVQAIV